MALIIGITGGIGSGKSTVCQVFQLLGVPVFKADEVSKQLLDTNDVIKSGLIRLFGNEIYLSDGKVDQKKLASIIFNNEAQLKKVNELIHPEVRAEFESWVKKHSHFPYVIHEAAILFESGFYKMMDFTILVSAPENQRIDRVMERNSVTEAEVKERIKRQWPEEKKQQLADKELINDNKNLIIPEIIQIDKNLKEYGKIW